MPQDHELRISRRFAAPRERVFNAFIDPAALSAWWGPESMTCPAPKVDARVGGRYELAIYNSEGEAHTVAGEYREIIEPTRLDPFVGNDARGLDTRLLQDQCLDQDLEAFAENVESERA